MWGGSISREQLQQQISLLALLGGVQESVKQHQLTSPSNYQSSLTIDQESEIVSNLSFLSSRRKDSKQVVAIAIEVAEKNKEMVIRMAVNGEDAAYLKEGLVKIGNILEKAARMDRSASYYTDLLLRQVITSDFSRISTRLQMSKKHPLTTSRIMTLHLLLHESTLNDTNGIDLLRASVQALKQCYSSLKGLPQLQVNSTTCAMLEEVTKLAYRLANADLGAALEKSSQVDKTQLIRLKDSVAKLGHYYKACSQLVAAAMRKKCSVFENIRVEDYQVSFPQTIKSSKPTSILPVLKSQIELLQQRPRIIPTLLRRVAIMRPCIKLHAEIKLLFFYETHPQNNRPRVIAANKSSCYLCDLFFSLHGQFQVPSTYGRLNERWILPDWIDGIPEQRVIVLRSIVGSISSILSKQVIAASRDAPRLPSPLQSLIGRSARWSASVLDLPSQLAQTLRTAPNISRADSKPINFDFESALPDNEGKPYLSPTCSLVVPITQGTSSSSASISREGAVLRLGESFSRQICIKDQSLTVHFYKHHAILSFGDTSGFRFQGQVKDLCLAIWVQVEILGSNNKTLLIEDGKNIKDVHMVPEGAEVALGSRDSDTPIYLCCNEMILSIRFITKSLREK
ncbi:hypothetical protein V496_01569 [Pseudogymnoascus sp. VKM F-4515 (FW-2607)]|nr:hypothetical protein V496_01569 [Pseudogymnoascus sp. VKM F-4515 (FW-2607)]